jgi:hypothetical protein
VAREPFFIRPMLYFQIISYNFNFTIPYYLTILVSSYHSCHAVVCVEFIISVYINMLIKIHILNDLFFYFLFCSPRSGPLDFNFLKIGPLVTYGVAHPMLYVKAYVQPLIAAPLCARAFTSERG